jgi:hypothetical protein
VLAVRQAWVVVVAGVDTAAVAVAVAGEPKSVRTNVAEW